MNELTLSLSFLCYVDRLKMSHNRNSQRTAFLDCIRNGDEEGVRRSLSTNENLDLLKEKFEQYRVSQ